MIKERISLSGDLKSKVKQLMIYAGWYEGRKVDISIASHTTPSERSNDEKHPAFLPQILWVMLSVVLFWWNETRRRF